MAKVYKVMDPLQPSTSAHHEQTDWSLCILCQENTSESLHCPDESKRNTQGAGYKTIAGLLERFSTAGYLPRTITMSRLDDGEGVEATLRKHKAKWHDSCRLQYNKTKLQRAEKRKRPLEDGDSQSYFQKFTRQSLGGKGSFIETCFFCDKPATSGKSLCKVSTLEVDSKVRECALKLQDQQLLARLSAGDLIAQDAMYHLQCLVTLYNRGRDVKASEESEIHAMNHGIAFAELVSYIEEARKDNLVASVFRLADLVNLYSTRLKQLGTDAEGRIHSTQLKDRILGFFEGMEAHKQGQDVMLISKEDVGCAVSKACKHDADNDADNDAIYLARAANIVRRDMFKMKNQFSDSFESKCQEESVPASLLALVAMVLNGPNIVAQSSSSTIPQPVLTISQLLMYNSIARHRKDVTRTTRHCKERETPLPIYLGVKIHTKTRKRELVDDLYELGLSVSYDRVLEISTDLGNKVCHQYMTEKVVCPPKLKCALFTTAAVDNIDHNPSSTSAHDSFHGTGISLFQHPSGDLCGFTRVFITDDTVSREATVHLPEAYTNITPIAGFKHDPPVPKLKGPNITNCQLIPQAVEKEFNWLKHLKQMLDNDHDLLNGDESISWAAYHASQKLSAPTDIALTSLLPLFHHQANSVAMIRHSMDVIKAAVNILNPDQTPIITCDQPLYALAKQIQWNWPNTYGEKYFFVMFGGLHIEMAAFKVLGDLLDSSGWTEALVQAGVATPGTADSFLKASHLTRTRRVHQLTAGSLYLLLVDAYTDYCKGLGNSSSEISLEKWCTEKAAACPHFQFWYIIFQLELYVMIYIKAIREGEFQLYVEALSKIVPWFFALDHTHYARWIPVHLRDLISLEECHPSIHEQFIKGNFAVIKSKRVFSAIAIDQAHEQNNASVKGDGGAVGLTENPTALHRWMVSDPEMARLIEEFDSAVQKKKCMDIHHHEQKKHVQINFAQDVKSLRKAIEQMGNPFAESSDDLLVLDSRNIADSAVADVVQRIERIGLDQYTAYVNERLVDQTVPITDVIKRNNLCLFSRLPVKDKSQKQLQLKSLKHDCSLFSKLYIASQIRNGDLDEFFKYENQPYPPSLSHLGVLRTGTKSDLLHCLEKATLVYENLSHPTVQVSILDGAALVNMLQPGTAKTFGDYATNVFIPYIMSQLQNVVRLDVIWDVYMHDSLKTDVRTKRGKGVRRRVEPSSLIPKNWKEFLRINDNKTELFSYLALSTVENIKSNKTIITTHQSNVLCINRLDVVGLAPCEHEEADTRIILHLEDAVREKYNKISIRTVDTDVVVLAITAAQRLNISKLWIAFGTGKNFRYLAIHEMARALGPERCIALPVFHAFTGCDTVSSFGGRGKKTAWDTWKAYEDVTSAFCALAACPSPETIDKWLQTLERFVVLLYDRTSSQESVNKARKELFTQKSRAIDALPPTQAALIQHTKRAVYQAGYCWSQAMIPNPELPSPNDWGWSKKPEGGWEVCWTTLPEASKVCRELVCCGCKKGCKGRCKCRMANLQCTALCLCGGLCTE